MFGTRLGRLACAVIGVAAVLTIAIPNGPLTARTVLASSLPSGSYPCNGVPYGNVIAPASRWASSLVVRTGAPSVDVYSNWNGSSCARSISGSDGSNTYGAEYQCTELAVRVADAQWASGGSSAWSRAGWNGNAYDMYRVGPGRGLSQYPNGSASAPQLGDLIIFGATSSDSTGHVAVVEGEAGGRVYFVGQNQGQGENSVPYTQSGGRYTLNGGNFIAGSAVTGWLRGASSGSGVHSAPAVAAAGGQQIVFFQGSNGNIHEAWFASGKWNGPIDEGIAWAATSGPSVAVDSSGTQIVFFRGTNGNLHEAWFAGGAWNGPIDEGSAWASAAGTAPAVTVTSGQQIVFFQGTNGNIHEAWYASGKWNGPIDEGASWAATSGPSVAVDSSGTQIVFFRGTNGNLHEAWFAGGAWNGPIDQGSAWASAAGSAPAVTTTSGQQIVFFQGTDGNIHEAWYASGKWNGPVDEGSTWAATSGPAAAVDSSGTQLVFFRGADGNVHEAWFANGSWNGPVDEGGAWAAF